MLARRIASTTRIAPPTETNLYPELAVELALVFVFDNQKFSVLRDPHTPDNTGSNPQRDLSAGGPIPAVPFGGPGRANLASWWGGLRPASLWAFGLRTDAESLPPLPLPEPARDHTHAPGRGEPYGRGGQDTTAHGDPERALVVPSEVVQHSGHPRSKSSPYP